MKLQTFYLEETQIKKLQRIATSRVKLSEHIRRAVDAYIKSQVIAK